MDTCASEVGLLKKHPCGEKAVTKCANCEMPLCAKHATTQMSAGKKTFLCAECAKAWKQQAKTVGELPSTPASAPHAAPKPAAQAPKPAAQPPKPAAQPPKPPAAEKSDLDKKEKPKEGSGPLEFTPSKKPEGKK